MKMSKKVYQNDTVPESRYGLTEEEIMIVEEKIATKGEIRYNPHCGKEQRSSEK